MTRNIKRIPVELLIGRRCITAEEGKVLNGVIEKALNTGESVELDFHGVEVITRSFYRTAVADLYCIFPEDFIDSNFSIVDFHGKYTS
jgi:hypothetical protein